MPSGESESSEADPPVSLKGCPKDPRAITRYNLLLSVCLVKSQPQEEVSEKTNPNIVGCFSNLKKCESLACTLPKLKITD